MSKSADRSWIEGSKWDACIRPVETPDVAPFAAFEVIDFMETHMPEIDLTEWQRKFIIGMYPNDERRPQPEG